MLLLLRFRNIGTAECSLFNSVYTETTRSYVIVSRDSYLFKCEYFRYTSYNSSAAVDAWQTGRVAETEAGFASPSQ